MSRAVVLSKQPPTPFQSSPSGGSATLAGPFLAVSSLSPGGVSFSSDGLAKKKKAESHGYLPPPFEALPPPQACMEQDSAEGRDLIAGVTMEEVTRARVHGGMSPQSPVHRSAPLIPAGLHCVGVPSLSDHRQANFFERRRPGRASRTENPSLVLTLALAWGRRGAAAAAAAAAWDAHRTTPTDTVGHFYLQSAPGPGWLTLLSSCHVHGPTPTPSTGRGGECLVFHTF